MKRHVLVTVFGLSVLMSAAGTTGDARQSRAQSLDGNGAPIFRVDPFWPKPLPNRWSMQQVTGIHVDHMDHIWFLNRARGRRRRRDRRRRQPAADRLLRARPRGHRARSGRQGGPRVGRPRLSPAVADGAADGHRRHEGLRLDRRHRAAGQHPQVHARRDSSCGTSGIVRRRARRCRRTTRRRTSWRRKGRFQLDEVANEIYIINRKRVLVYDMDTGAFKRGWGGHGMPLSEISNEPIPPYTWTGAPPPPEKNFVPDLHFVEISTRPAASTSASAARTGSRCSRPTASS